MHHARDAARRAEHDRDDAAAAVGDHRADGDLLGQVPGGVQVEAAHRGPAVGGDLLGRGRELAAGVVDEHVDAAVRLQGEVDQRVRHLGLPDVAGQRQAVGLPDRGLRLGQRLRPAAGDHDLAAVAVQGQRRRPADAGAAAGDDRDPAHDARKLSAECASIPCASFSSSSETSSGLSAERSIRPRVISSASCGWAARIPAHSTAAASASPSATSRLTTPSSAARAASNRWPSRISSFARAGADRPGQAGQPAGAGKDAQRDLGQLEARRLVGDPQVGRQRQLQAAADRPAGDGGDRGLRQRRQRLPQPSRAAVVADGRLGAGIRELGEVGAGRERPLGAGHDHGARLPHRGRRQRGQVLLAQLLGQRVQLLVAAQPDDHDAVLLGLHAYQGIRHGRRIYRRRHLAQRARVPAPTAKRGSPCTPVRGGRVTFGTQTAPCICRYTLYAPAPWSCDGSRPERARSPPPRRRHPQPVAVAGRRPDVAHP